MAISSSPCRAIHFVSAVFLGEEEEEEEEDEEEEEEEEGKKS